MRELAERRRVPERVSTALFLLACIVSASPAWAYEIWVTNQGLDKVHVIDGDTLRELAIISTASKPHNIEFSADLSRAYVPSPPCRALSHSRLLASWSGDDNE